MAPSTAGLSVPSFQDPQVAVESAASWSQREPSAGLVEYLLGTVGPRITAYGSGLGDARQLKAWRAGQEPREAVRRQRLVVMGEVVKAITVDHEAVVAATFLRSSQPALDDESPLDVLRAAEGKSVGTAQARVRRAVRAFLAG